MAKGLLCPQAGRQKSESGQGVLFQTFCFDCRSCSTVASTVVPAVAFFPAVAVPDMRDMGYGVINQLLSTSRWLLEWV